jgi:hypothetical protein
LTGAADAIAGSAAARIAPNARRKIAPRNVMAGYMARRTRARKGSLDLTAARAIIGGIRAHARRSALARFL